MCARTIIGVLEDLPARSCSSQVNCSSPRVLQPSFIPITFIQEVDSFVIEAVMRVYRRKRQTLRSAMKSGWLYFKLPRPAASPPLRIYFKT
jgi:hypothetical protein